MGASGGYTNAVQSKAGRMDVCCTAGSVVYTVRYTKKRGVSGVEERRPSPSGMGRGRRVVTRPARAYKAGATANNVTSVSLLKSPFFSKLLFLFQSTIQSGP